MNFNGTINLKRPIELNGKHHGHEMLSTLPVWQSTDVGRMVFASDTARMYVGGLSDWEELTQSSSNTDYDYRYYTKTQTDGFFGPESAGKKTVDWSNVSLKPSTFVPASHDNTSHTQQYITLSSVTFESLQTNGSVGTGTTQVAAGNHNHDSVYSVVGHAHTGMYEPYITSKKSAFNVDFGSSHATAAYGDHDHASTYEPIISTKKSAFNVDFGSSHAEVSYGDHTHSEFEPTITKNSGFNLSVGTTSGTVAAGDHSHDSAYVKLTDLYTDIYNKSEVYSKSEVDLLIPSGTTVYEPVISVKKSAFNVDFGTTHTTAAYGDHGHTSLGVSYDHTASGLVASTAQAAIDEIDSKIDNMLPTTKTLHVDKNRTDTYTETGSILKPFKTIQGAIDQAATNNDNSIDPYNIIIENGKYYETITLESLNLYHIMLTGHGIVQIRPTTSQSLKSVANNTNLKTLHLRNITFLAPVVVTGANGTTAFKDLIWDDCNFVSGDGAQVADITLSCINNITIRRSYLDINNVTYNNVNYSIFDDSNIGAMFNINVSTLTDAPEQGASGAALVNNSMLMGAPVFTSGGTATLQFITNNSTLLAGMSTGTVTIPARVTVSAYSSFYRGTWTNNGTLNLRNSNVNALLGTAPVTAAQPASQIGNVASGTITALNVQDAINQLAANVVFPVISAAPTDTPAPGTVRYDYTNNDLYIYAKDSGGADGWRKIAFV